MFGTQALRLLREKWPGADELSQELYAIFQDKNPTSSGPLTITNNTPAGAGLTIQNLGGSGDVMTFSNGKDPPTTFTLGKDGGLVVASPSFTTPSGGGGGGGVPAQILSGTGASYQATVFPTGLAGLTQVVAVRQLQIDAAETIPPGTWTFANLVGVNYYIQVPVWGPDL